MTTKGEEKPPPLKDIPDIIVNPATKKRYMKGRFLGKGGFARCYEMTDPADKKVYAGKIVSKSLLTKKHQKDKMAQEISIHRSLAHKHIVDFVSYFEDDDNVYILLELCSKRSLMELHKRRRAITEPEARYYMYQIVDACIYLHTNRVIHRDLKLGNLFLNDEMEIKIGDFGLATKLDHHGERKKTLCGTPNYIAPEMLNKKGHSYEVDIWALGCILFTLLVGKPPFETQSLKDTYARIRTNEYHIPSKVGTLARHLITKLLQPDPCLRPNIHEVLTFEFFTQGYMPSGLPHSCLTMEPNFRNSPQQNATNLRRPLTDNTNKDASPMVQAKKDQLGLPVRSLKSVPENQLLNTDVVLNKGNVGSTGSDHRSPNSEHLLNKLARQLGQLLDSKPTERAKIIQDEAEDPAATPVFWISKWVDYSDKYGLGYQLSDNSVGVWFNDFTRVILNGNQESLQYIEKDNNEGFHSLKSYPKALEKKVTLLNYFRNYMNEHLLKAGSHIAVKESDELARLPCLQQWFRTRSAIVFHLNNGTLQINFFQDHTKLIMCPFMGAVTYINENREFRTYKLDSLEKYGVTTELNTRLVYARTMIDRLLLRYTGKSSTLASTVSTAGQSSKSSAPSTVTRTTSARLVK